MKIDKSGRITETAVEARAGYLDRPVLLVLAVSCGLAVAFYDFGLLRRHSFLG